jgi:hypothetical protein
VDLLVNSTVASLLLLAHPLVSSSNSSTVDKASKVSLVASKGKEDTGTNPL